MSANQLINRKRKKYLEPNASIRETTVPRTSVWPNYNNLNQSLLQKLEEVEPQSDGEIWESESEEKLSFLEERDDDCNVSLSDNSSCSYCKDVHEDECFEDAIDKNLEDTFKY